MTKIKQYKWATANWRFGASGGVVPRKMKWEYERL